MESLRLSGKFRLVRLANRMRVEDFHPDIHCAQFVWVTTFQNQNPESPDYQDFFWVVMGILDTRYDFPPLYRAQDKAMPDGKYIYSFCARDYLSESILHFNEVSVDFELLKILPKILESARSAGYLTHTSFEDLALNSTNLGFELTGTFDAEMEVSDLSIAAAISEGSR